MVESEFYKWVQIRNCRRFYKRYYSTIFNADQSLLKLLQIFGLLEVQEFSKYAPSALDAFSIKLENEIDISGALGSKELQVTILKTNPHILKAFEDTLAQWVKTQREIKINVS
ncbi:hypothetical protein BKI52_05335 [marine bacterium AO1-C]|nr:hypothetical protein BKI52_05335 [marine bacterium AO1-C]